MGRARDVGIVVGTVAALVVVQLCIYVFGVPGSWLVLGVAVAVTIAVRLAGLSWGDLGLSRHTLGRGIRWAVVIVVVVAVIAAVGVALPFTRELFRNDAYADLPEALFAAGVLIPLQTVIGEELLFRGALLGALLRVSSTRGALGIQALLFGAWHVGSSQGLTAGNDGLREIVGDGTFASLVGVLLAVAVTAAAGALLGWSRLRSGSLLAPMALHWAANGIGAVAAAMAWQFTG
ncbi:CPBP family intramembrane glutamic endopeptidase [Gordonia desulfuricans]|uniref:CPBP family intramembrane glutamic endopeptidase n=1 Tax=Gordonia desulfuricans TaxID=89051 RepID=UPI00073F9118|nr:CPBP family intramembrane glutamic endopeptidase [Gordonia desulfuricans]